MTGQAHDRDEDRAKVANLISSVVNKVEKSDYSSKEAIFHEIEMLQRVIDDARRDLGGTGAAEINAKHIPNATDELDAIVEATAMATGEIMDSCEVIQDKLAGVDDENVKAALEEVTKIYEACTFQDITGQRISKIVKALHSIEEKVSEILSVLAKKIPGIEYQESVDEREGDEKLLNGPQMKDEAISQEEIDKLLDDLFD